VQVLWTVDFIAHFLGYGSAMMFPPGFSSFSFQFFTAHRGD